MKPSAFLLRVLICFLLSLIPLHDIENRIYSERIAFRAPRPAAADPVLVVLDEGASGDDQSNLPRILARMERKLPRTILIPWVAPRSIWPRRLRFNRTILTSSQFDPEGKLRSVLDPENLTEHTGFANLLVDSDGEVRRFEQIRSGEPSIARVFVTDVLKATPLSETQPLINYVGPAGSIAKCRFNDCGKLAGRIVILSQSQERFKTPLGEMTRAEILANSIRTILDRSWIQEATPIETQTILFLLIVMAALCILRYSISLSAIAVIASGLLILGPLFQWLLVRFKFYIPSANIACALLFTYLIFTGYRLAVQENLRWRSLKQAQYMKELEQMKSNFLSLVSHDLKTPIAKIQAVTERMKRESATPELIDSIENSNNELKHTIQSLLNLSRIESRKVILNKKSNDINRVILEVLRRLRSIAQGRLIEIEENLEPLFSIEFDEDLIRQVLTNLIDNAIKYSPEKSKVIVRSREESGFVEVAIEDFGPGIPKEQLPFMFRKFSRLKRPVHEKVKGTGLGLYLSKYFIELHGGSIRVQSEAGRGTTFSFKLPLAGAEGETILG